MEKQTSPTPIPARPKAPEITAEDEYDPFMAFIEALAERRAILDARASSAANLDDRPTAREKER